MGMVTAVQANAPGRMETNAAALRINPGKQAMKTEMAPNQGVTAAEQSTLAASPCWSLDGSWLELFMMCETAQGSGERDLAC